MSHPLSQSLRAFATLLDQNSASTGEKAILAGLDKMANDIVKLSNLIQSRSAGDSPEAAELRNYILQHFGQANDTTDLRGYAKQVLIKAPLVGKKSFGEYLEVVVQKIVQTGNPQQARLLLKRRALAIDLDFKDEAVLEEIRKLGAMDPATLRKQMFKLSEHPERVERMARLAGIIKPPKSKSMSKKGSPPTTKSLLTKLRKLGETFQENRGV